MTSTSGSAASAQLLSLRAGDVALEVRPARLIVAGYTGRDESVVQAHIDELDAIGIAPPDEVPTLFDLDPELVTTAPIVALDGENTSGEVEPVLVRHDGLWYLGVGSDHTDRDLERQDIARSKAACPKPMGDTVLPLPDGLPDGDWDQLWDAARASSKVDGQPYQEGTLADLRLPSDLIPRVLGLVGDAGDIVVFCGTFPIIDGGFRPGSTWDLSLNLSTGEVLQHTYESNEGNV